MKNPIKSAINWYFSRRSLPYWIVIIIDSLVLFFAGFLTFWLFHRGMATLQSSYALARVLLVYVLLSWISMRVFSTYSGIIRYSSFLDLRRVTYANIMSFVIVWALHYLIFMLPPTMLAHMNGREILVMFTLATVAMCGIRVLTKTVFEQLHMVGKAKRTLIYGTMSGAVALAKSIRLQDPVRFELRGFITHDLHDKHDQLLGQPIYSTEDDLASIIQLREIEAVLISPLRNEDFRKDQHLQDLLIGAGVKIFMVYDAREMGDSGDDANIQLHEVSVEDLLPREEIVVDMDSVGRELRGKSILITGSAGSIGSEMVRQVAIYKPARMVLLDQAETPQHDILLMMQRDFPDIESHVIVTSISRKTRMEDVFNRYRFDYVFHAAAYKHVPMMEDNPSEAVLNNIYGTKIIADMSVKYGVSKFVMVSTDKAVNPTNVMGCSKRICEIYVQSLNGDASNKGTQFVTTRFGNVLGSNGSVIPLFQEQIKNGGPVTVTHPDIIRYFMLIPEACKLVLEAGTKGHGGEIFVFDMGEPVKIADLARRMIQLSGAKNVDVEFTGLREGEKLYEEVLNDMENTKPSFHEKIRIAEVRQYDYEQVSKDINELVDISKQFDDMETVRKMKAIVPEYISNNSVYEQLDAKH